MMLTAAFAQNPNMTPGKGGRVPHYIPVKNTPTTQTTQTIYVDYDYMDEDYQVNTNGYTYTRYIWDMNMNYDYTLGDTSLRWAAVDFDKLYDSYVSTTQIPYTSFTSLTIDSVFFLAGHENNSGQNDTIEIQIVQLTNGYPSATATVLNTTTLVSNTGLSTGNDWLTTAVIGAATNYTINNNTTKFGVRIQYHGARQDTFGMLAGFGDLGAGNCGSLPTLPNYAVKSQYAVNSYRHDMRFALPPYNIQQLPTSSGADTYYDCDGSGNYNSSGDSENFLQNWGIWVKLTMNGVGVEEFGTTGIQLDQNMPNPANGSTTIRYSIAEKGSVSFQVFDITGKEVLNMNQGEQLAGNHQIEMSTAGLQAGVYFYTLTVDGKKATRRMVIAE